MDDTYKCEAVASRLWGCGEWDAALALLADRADAGPADPHALDQRVGRGLGDLSPSDAVEIAGVLGALAAPSTAIRKVAAGVPPFVKRSSGASTRFPIKLSEFTDAHLLVPWGTRSM